MQAEMKNVARIAELMGGFELLEDGGCFVIGPDRAFVLGRDLPEDSEDDRDDDYELSEVYGDAIMPLVLTRFRTDPDGTMIVWVSFDKVINGDIVHEPLQVFETTLADWRSGRWTLREFQTAWSCFGFNADTPNARREWEETAAGCTGMDRESIGVRNALRVAERYNKEQTDDAIRELKSIRHRFKMMCECNGIRDLDGVWSIIDGLRTPPEKAPTEVEVED